MDTPNIILVNIL